MLQDALLALDIGGSAVKYGIWTKHQLIKQAQFPTPLTRNRFYSEVEQLRDQFATDFHLTGIAVSCPGDPDEQTGIIHGMSYVPYFCTSVNFKLNLQRALVCPSLSKMMPTVQHSPK